MAEVQKQRVKVEPTQFTAVLLNGRVYTYGNQTFYNNEPAIVDAETKAALEEQAVDKSTVTRGTSVVSIDVCKFEFAPVYDEEVEEVTKAVTAAKNAGNKKRKEEDK